MLRQAQRPQVITSFSRSKDKLMCIPVPCSDTKNQYYRTDLLQSRRWHRTRGNGPRLCQDRFNHRMDSMVMEIFSKLNDSAIMTVFNIFRSFLTGRNWCLGSSAWTWGRTSSLGSDWAPNRDQRGCGVFITGDIPKPSGHNPVLWDGPAWSEA